MMRWTLTTALMAAGLVATPLGAPAQDDDRNRVLTEGELVEEPLPGDDEEREDQEGMPQRTNDGLSGEGTGGVGGGFQRGQEVEYTVEDLQRLINQPDGAAREEWEEDPEDPRVIFDPQDAPDALGEKPRFIYFPQEPDPMIIPWVRARVVAEGLMQEVEIARENQDFEKAKEILRQIQEQYPDTAEGRQAPQVIAAIDQQLEAQRQAAQPDPEPEPEPEPAEEVAQPAETEVVLPSWIEQNTTGIMVNSQGENVVVVENEFLSEGDPVPRYAMVSVKRINPSTVVYNFQGKDFELSVDGAF